MFEPSFLLPLLRGVSGLSLNDSLQDLVDLLYELCLSFSKNFLSEPLQCTQLAFPGHLTLVVLVIRLHNIQDVEFFFFLNLHIFGFCEKILYFGD